jgi:hypothetical protein
MPCNEQQRSHILKSKTIGSCEVILLLLNLYVSAMPATAGAAATQKLQQQSAVGGGDGRGGQTTRESHWTLRKDINGGHDRTQRMIDRDTGTDRTTTTTTQQ